MRNPIASAAAAFRALRSDERGAGLVEMALVAPLLGLFTVGIVDLSQAASQRFAMQQAVDRSLQMLVANPQQGDPADDGIDYSYVAEEAAAAAGVPEEDVELETWLQCQGDGQVRKLEFDDPDGCEEGEDTARYLSLDMSDAFQGKVWIGTIDLVASGAVRIQ